MEWCHVWLKLKISVAIQGSRLILQFVALLQEGDPPHCFLVFLSHLFFTPSRSSYLLFYDCPFFFLLIYYPYHSMQSSDQLIPQGPYTLISVETFRPHVSNTSPAKLFYVGLTPLLQCRHPSCLFPHLVSVVGSRGDRIPPRDPVPLQHPLVSASPSLSIQHFPAADFSPPLVLFQTMHFLIPSSLPNFPMAVACRV